MPPWAGAGRYHSVGLTDEAGQVIHLVVGPLVLHLGQVRQPGRPRLLQHPLGDVADGVSEHVECLGVAPPAAQPLLEQVLVERVAQRARGDVT